MLEGARCGTFAPMVDPGRIAYRGFEYQIHATAWLLTGSIPGVLISSRFTVRLPDVVLRLSLGTILVLSGLKLLNVPAAQWILLGGLIALGLGLLAYGVDAWVRRPPLAQTAYG